MKISEVIDRVIAYHPPFQDDPKHPSVDTVKSGDPKQECTGIVVTVFASADVIRKARDLKANLIIVHEPLFWNHRDETDWLENSTIYQEKKKLLEDGGIVVWRDHDHIHSGTPRETPFDGIYDGIMRELGWENYLIGEPNKPLLFDIPKTDATELGRFLKNRLNLNGIRICGDPHTEVSRVFFWEHITGKSPDENEKLLMVDQSVDAVIPLEIIDWTICAYIRDASLLGHPKILYNIGHFNFEEIAMKHLASILPDLVDDVPVHFVQSGDSFEFII